MAISKNVLRFEEFHSLEQTSMKKYILKKQISIRFSVELKELIAKIAKIENRKFANLVNKIIEDHFKAIDDKTKYYSKEIVDLINKWREHDPK